jgi:hypothetical protein
MKQDLGWGLGWGGRSYGCSSTSSCRRGGHGLLFAGATYTAAYELLRPFLGLVLREDVRPPNPKPGLWWLVGAPSCFVFPAGDPT